MTRIWTITDTALATIDSELAANAPERGGVLLGPAGYPLVTDALIDPVMGGAVEYFHSDTFLELAQEYLQRNPTVTYRGSIHSHPRWLAAPSAPDHRAFTSALSQNPGLGDMLFPIVVQNTAAGLAESFQGEHLLRVEHGTVALFSGHLTPDGAAVERATGVVMPIGQVLEAIRGAIDPDAAVVVASAFDGTPLMRVNVAGGELFLPLGFPLTAPLVRLRDAQGTTAAAWDPSADPVKQILGVLGAARKTSRPTAMSAETLRHGLEARTLHHLPRRGPWRVAVLGAGSVGSVLTEALVRSGIRNLTIVDPDTVEPANLSRTVYSVDDIGHPKVAALAGRLTGISPDVDVEPVAQDVQTWLPDRDVGDFDLIVLATDDTLAELSVNDVAYTAGVPMVSVKMFAKGEAGEILICDPTSASPCLRCLTAGRAAPAGRRVDYGSGRLEAELALGCDIASVTHKAAKVVLALLARTVGTGPLVDWINPLLRQGRTMILTSTTPDWGIFAHLGTETVGLDGPYQTLWIPLAERDASCPVCGTDSVSVPGVDGEAHLLPDTRLPDCDDDWLQEALAEGDPGIVDQEDATEGVRS